MAYECLSWLKQWGKQPIVCWPRQIDILPSSNANPFRQAVNVRTFPQRPLKISSNNPDVKVEVSHEWVEGDFGYYYDQTIYLNVPPEGVKPGFEAVISVGDANDPAVEDHITMSIQNIGTKDKNDEGNPQEK